MNVQEKGLRKLSIIVLIISIFWLFNTDRYIRSNIINIDKTDTVEFFYEDKTLSYPFNEELVDYVSYGGYIVKVDNYFENIFYPYSNKLEKIDMHIIYIKSDDRLARAEIYRSNDNLDEYILYMNHVYWKTGFELEELVDFIK